jgi:hypothetical protein
VRWPHRRRAHFLFLFHLFAGGAEPIDRTIEVDQVDRPLRARGSGSTTPGSPSTETVSAACSLSDISGLARWCSLSLGGWSPKALARRISTGSGRLGGAAAAGRTMVMSPAAPNSVLAYSVRGELELGRSGRSQRATGSSTTLAPLRSTVTARVNPLDHRLACARPTFTHLITVSRARGWSERGVRWPHRRRADSFSSIRWRGGADRPHHRGRPGRPAAAS